jgi:streptogramin lyase
LTFAGDPKILPIVKNAGKDVSHWFDAATGSLVTHIDPKTGLSLSECFDGELLHIYDSRAPRSDWTWEGDGTPWWKATEKYIIGKLSVQTRKIRIVNTLSHLETIVEVRSSHFLVSK